MLTKLRAALHTAKDRGASAVEYGLMVAAIAAVIVGIVFGLGNLVGDQFNKTCNAVDTGQAAPLGGANANPGACQQHQAPPAAP